ncbi:hypothetical protein PVAND_016593 [Polypedilum vanderplanki]|uniref:SH3 domain-containing protein n=1 Tax=Polypedilum vanderplanki TaxID=319348 RepID=A0A9J6BGM2_POLVA|nr:hypothetical protein PVAND_016593 [Polypedilum vanderplanki]
MSYDDDWETDASYENKITEDEQRWGKGVDRGAAIDMQKLIEETEKADEEKKKKLVETGITGSHGYGGKFGVQKDRMDKSALGHDYIGKVEKHGSQKDYTGGFGGKFGVDKDRMDKSAVGFDYVGKVEKHDSQADYKKGFGGKFGLETDRMDKSAHTFQEQVDKVGTNYQKIKPDISGAKPSNLKSRFENMAIHSEEETKQRAAIQKKLREEKDLIDKQQAAKEHTVEEATKEVTRKTAIVTGRNEKISNVINVFNAPPPSDEFKPAPKQPIKLPKETKPAEPVEIVKPDIISSTEKHLDMPAHQGVSAIAQNFSQPAAQSQPQKQEEQQSDIQRHSVEVVREPERHSNGVSEQKVVEEVVQKVQEIAEPEVIEQELIEQLKNDTVEPVEEEEQFVLSPDNPGITAIALYDYQAAAEDEISFDPDDLITHIDMIDPGWYKGLHAKTYTYGLFPANYVQIQE